MAKDRDHLADSFEADESDGFLADEDQLDRRALWRLGSWGVAAVGAVTLAVMANQSSLGLRRDQIAAADLSRQAQQIQMAARESQSETRRLASAIDTLSGDRDRLYSRVTSLEQGLDSVTGAIVRQDSVRQGSIQHGSPGAGAAADPKTSPAPLVAPVTTTARDEPPAVTAAVNPASAAPASPGPSAPTPATPLMDSKSIMAPPDPAAGKLIEAAPPQASVPAIPPDIIAAAPAATDEEADEATTPKAAIQRTEFGVDLGTANTVGGLRALWRGVLKSRSNGALSALRPIIMVKEATNGALQLRLVAGPLNDAGAAAKICAVLTENKRACETSVFDGQRLAMNPADPAAAPTVPRRRSPAKRADAAVSAAPSKPEGTNISGLFGRKNTP